MFAEYSPDKNPHSEQSMPKMEMPGNARKTCKSGQNRHHASDFDKTLHTQQAALVMNCSIAYYQNNQLYSGTWPGIGTAERALLRLSHFALTSTEG